MWQHYRKRKETGSICLVTNEGNADLVAALPKTQITVMGMERLVPSFEELEVLVSLLTRSAVGQKLTSYITTLTGTKDEGDVDGPDEFHLVIVDNGRSDILGGEFQSILQCIRCAACVNVCPVYPMSAQSIDMLVVIPMVRSILVQLERFCLLY